VTRLRSKLSLAASIAAAATLLAPAEVSAIGAVPADTNTANARIAHTPSTGGTHAPAHRAQARKHGSSCVHGAAKRRDRGSAKAGCTASSHGVKATRKQKQRSSAKPAASQSSTAGETAESQATAIAKVLATPCQNTGLTPEPANLPAVRAAVLCLVNTERAQNGRAPLQPNALLEAAAESHGREMIAEDYFDHISPSGITPVDRVREAGYIPNSEVGYVVGENLAWGTLTLSTPEAIVKAWIASPEHLANILEAKYVETGIDVEPTVPQSLAEGVQGALYTQEFGVIIR
jgi:uncharacterized protein YkwD